MTTPAPNEPAPTKTASHDAILKVISLKKLMIGDEATSIELLKACKDVGFFYLDCNDWEEGAAAYGVSKMFKMSERLYNLPREEKLKWAADKEHGGDMIVGYKQAGVSSGPVEGKKDGFEGFMIFEHALGKVVDGASMQAPQPLRAESGLLQSGVSTLNDIGITILDSLSKSLGITGKESFTETHRKGVASTTALGLLKYTTHAVDPEKIGHIAHTDAGSLSLVFSNIPGLQVLMPHTDEWTYIAPRPGHAVVNVGDSLQNLSGNILRSSLHRVVPHPDALDQVKYTIVYLMRPETDAVFRDSEGKEWKSVDWCNKKFAVFRASTEEQSKGSVLTGRKGYMGHWDPSKKAAMV